MAINPLYPNAPGYDNYHLPAFPSLVAKGVEKQMEDVLNFDSKETDILLSTFPKSGKNWVGEILHMLNIGKAEYIHVKDLNAMLEAADFGNLEDRESPKVLNSHLPFRHLPKKHIENGYKVIYVTRNPKDVAVSFYNHIRKVKMMATESFPGSWDTYIDNVIERKIGEVGNWKQWFTVDQNERFDELIKREMKDSNIKITYEL